MRLCNLLDEMVPQPATVFVVCFRGNRASTSSQGSCVILTIVYGVAIYIIGATLVHNNKLHVFPRNRGDRPMYCIVNIIDINGM